MGLNVISASSDERTPDERKKIFFIEVVFKGRFKLFLLGCNLDQFFGIKKKPFGFFEQNFMALI